MNEELEEKIGKAQTILQASRRITVLTGAGISTDSGIPDFRGPNGLWTKDPDAERAATLTHYLEDDELRQKSWRNRVRWIDSDPQPNAGHFALLELERRDALIAIVTQNVDELHQRAGHDPTNVLEVHGTIHRTCCWKCKDRRPMVDALARVIAGDADPRCELCGRALTASEECDVLLAVGTSLSVYPAANAVPRAKAAGAALIIVNGQPTEMDDRADVVINAGISEVLPQLCKSI
jgi:NAD-dependent deacetylase